VIIGSSASAWPSRRPAGFVLDGFRARPRRRGPRPAARGRGGPRPGGALPSGDEEPVAQLSGRGYAAAAAATTTSRSRRPGGGRCDRAGGAHQRTDDEEATVQRRLGVYAATPASRGVLRAAWPPGDDLRVGRGQGPGTSSRRPRARGIELKSPAQIAHMRGRPDPGRRLPSVPRPACRACRPRDRPRGGPIRDGRRNRPSRVPGFPATICA
jgi:translation initiation factor IF-2